MVMVVVGRMKESIRINGIRMNLIYTVLTAVADSMNIFMHKVDYIIISVWPEVFSGTVFVFCYINILVPKIMIAHAFIIFSINSDH